MTSQLDFARAGEWGFSRTTTVVPQLAGRLVGRFGERPFIGAIRAVIHDDFSLESVPHPVWFKGVNVCIPFLERHVFAAPGMDFRQLPTRSNGQPGIASYRRDASGDWRADGLWVLTIVEGRFSRATKLHDPDLVTAAGFPVELAS